MSRIYSGSKTGQKRGNALFFTLVLLMSTMLAMVAVPEASADDTTSTATTLSTGYSYEYVCENQNFDHPGLGLVDCPDGLPRIEPYQHT